MLSVFSHKQVIEIAYLRTEIEPKFSGKVVDFLRGAGAGIHFLLNGYLTTRVRTTSDMVNMLLMS